MQLIQYKGPFTAGESFTVPAQYDYTYVHIGIQFPNIQPIAYITDGATTADVEIGEMDGGTVPYRINETGILEFDGLAQNSWRIRFLKDIPMEGIIDITYTTTNEEKEVG